MVTMVKLTALFGHPEDPEAFEEYYANQHLPLAAKIPNVERFESGRVRTADEGEPPYHRIVELWFESVEQMGEALSSPVRSSTQPATNRPASAVRDPILPISLIASTSSPAPWGLRHPSLGLAAIGERLGETVLDHALPRRLRRDLPVAQWPADHACTVPASSPAPRGTPPSSGLPRPAREPGWRRPGMRGQPCPAA